MKLHLAERARVARDILRLRFTAADGTPLPSFEAGAHLELAFAGFARRYSLTSDPADRDGYEIMVKRAVPGRGGSAYLHDRLQPGSEIEASGPWNAFGLDAAARHHVFIAGGIGVTPFLSMARTLAWRGRSFDLHHVVRHRDGLVPFAVDGGDMRRHVTSEGARPDIDRIVALAQPCSCVYVCGPRSLIEAVRTAGLRHGLPASRIRVESFGHAPLPGDGPVSIRLAQSGLTLTAMPDRSLLDTLVEAGVWAPFECRRGECASCAVGFTEGDVDHRDLCLSLDQRRTLICTCVSWARSERLVLDL